jgi:flagellar biosynthetic protein FliR
VIHLSTGQLETWLGQFLWPFVRIGSCLMVAPVFSSEPVPARVRILIAGAITAVVGPLVPPPVGIVPFSVAGVVVTLQQVLIGAAMGFALQLVFEAANLSGELLANSMGLSFAYNVDPMRGNNTPTLGQFYTVLVVLTFLALDGHLALIETLARSMQSLPVGMTGLGNDTVWTLIGWGAELFSGALSIALPGVTALLIVNLGFGVVSRAAPSFNLFAIGFPVSLFCGLVILLVGLPATQAGFVELLGLGTRLVSGLVGLGD